MDDEATQCTQNTQGVVDPRRMGRNNSGLSEADIADVMCILHPCSPAAFKIVASTADRTPHNVLQNDGLHKFVDDLTPSALEEQETFILPSGTSTQVMDLALRFSTPVRNSQLGFVFGRNPDACDIVLSTDTCKRVSNMHFSIFVNPSGVILLQDMSTNGTIVDEMVLRGKGQERGLQTRMLNSGSIVQILSPRSEEVVKFIVRIPNREGHHKDFQANLEAHLRHIQLAGARDQERGLLRRRPTAADPITHKGVSLSGQLMHNSHGMHWSGGDRYNVVGLIGKGAFATVYQLATKSEGQLFAAKELEKRRFVKNGVMDRKLDNEMQIMKATDHKNIVKYVEYVDQPKHMYIIMEFVPCGDLAQYLSNNGPLHENLAKQMAEQVLEALAYLHKKKITHRDIKPDNILLANMDPNNFIVKLSDFGLSKVVKDNETFLKTFCGTLLYCAPEVFPHYDAHVAGKGLKRPRKSLPQHPKKTYHSYSQTVDIWSFGAVLWYSLCTRPPFEGVADNTGRGMFDKIMMTPLDSSDLEMQGVSSNAVALLADMLNTDPATRPTPAQCLRHEWFGFEGKVVEGAEDDALGSIAEEAEDEPDVSGLSLDELEDNDEDNHDSQTSEVSIHSGSIEFLDPRKSKRLKADTHAYREPDDLIESSPELLYQSIPIMHQPDAPASARPSSQTARPKLFGEISQSTLGPGGALPTPKIAQGRSHQQDPASQTRDVPDADERAGARGNMASPSLLGAESMVRDLNMNSPQSVDSSQGAESNGLPEPETPAAQVQFSSSRNGQQDDITPKPRQQAHFSRQINIPVPASFYYIAGDPSTHNLEFASKVSGHDYLSNPSYIKELDETSLPATMSAGSATDQTATDDEADHNETYNDSAAAVTMSRAIAIPPPSEFVKPPPRLGRLYTTPDSFTQLTINLSSMLTIWGRDPTNTHRYSDAKDTRIAKRCILLYFHAKGIADMSEDDQRWIHLPDLHCIITTQSSLGIYVNGVMLKKAEVDKYSYGKVYSGDEITVIQPDREGKGGLKFVCEFLHGEGAKRRPEGGARFGVQTTAGGEASKARDEGAVVAKEHVAAAS